MLRHLKQAVVSGCEEESSSDGLNVGRIKNPHSIHHRHTQHPWVLARPCPAKIKTYSKNVVKGSDLALSAILFSVSDIFTFICFTISVLE